MCKGAQRSRLDCLSDPLLPGLPVCPAAALPAAPCRAQAETWLAAAGRTLLLKNMLCRAPC